MIEPLSVSVVPSVILPATSTTAMTGASFAPVMVTVTSWVSVAAVGIIDGNRVHDGDGLARGEEVKLGLGDGVVPVDGTVVGVARIGTDGEGILDRGLLRSRQGQYRVRRSAHGLGHLGRRRGIGQVEIGKGDRASIGERGTLGDTADHVDNRDDRGIVAPVMVTVTSWVSVPPLASLTVIV